ncbi:MAG: NAD-dependent epimerase/dehydratase family protein [Candidatus Moranbacteria bacterium]|nr:NAD-dependent epimerase/dehydratase family protein [Candidatus Moranbacteria bacterium]
MRYKKILITGGAGFVGSNLCLKFKKKYPETKILALDNLKRRGSELNIPRLKQNKIEFIHGDIRDKEDFEGIEKFDLLIECSAEPSVLAGINSSPSYVINTNLIGAINCLEEARKNKADFVFLSTSRVYPIELINQLNFQEKATRFTLLENQKIRGASHKGISENFPLDKPRSIYGSTKLAAELFVQEYIQNYNLKGIINRCGLITGPWQMGKIDQGVIVLWAARHYFGGQLSYIGYGGQGKQVRDFIHIDDLFDILDIQLKDIEKYNAEIFNIGGGIKNSLSLLELTRLCQKISANKIKINSVKETRPADLRFYISDCEKIKKLADWEPKKNAQKTLEDIFLWIEKNEKQLKPILTN